MTHQPLEFHPVCEIFPLMQGEEYDRLVDDIRENGQRERIWLYKGKIIDGRNRYRACLDAEVSFRTQNWDGDATSLVKFVVSLNLHRRHLTSSQRAAAAAEALSQLKHKAKERQREGGRHKVPQKIAEARTGKDDASGLEAIAAHNAELYGEVTEQAARTFGTNRAYVRAAAKLRDEEPKAFAAVKDGELTLAQMQLIDKYIGDGKAHDFNFVGPPPDGRGSRLSVGRRAVSLSLSTDEKLILAKLGRQAANTGLNGREYIERTLDIFEKDDPSSLQDAVTKTQTEIRERKADLKQQEAGQKQQREEARRQDRERIEREWQERDPYEHFADYLIGISYNDEEITVLRRHLENCKLKKLLAAVDALLAIHEAEDARTA